jgi:hypothetical protein
MLDSTYPTREHATNARPSVFAGWSTKESSSGSATKNGRSGASTT